MTDEQDDGIYRPVLRCAECDMVQQSFEADPERAFYTYLDDDNFVKDAPCAKCGALKLEVYNGDFSIQLMGNARGYQSMEAYWAKNPDVARKHEDEIMTKREQRADWAKERVDNTGSGGKAGQRHSGYAKGDGEKRQSF